jgi:hypothetical protein
MEHILANKIIKHGEENNILYLLQHGFRKPWGTPESTLTASEVDPSITTDCFLFASQFCIHLTDFPMIP